MNIDAAGMADGALYLASPNCDERPPDTAIELLVIHNISLPPGVFTGKAVTDLFLNRLDPEAHPYFATIAGLRVSAHFFIRRDGALLQFVPCEQRAWHAGQSLWRGRERCNDFSIGVELEGADDLPFSDAQYDRLGALARALHARYPIAASVGHSDIAPGRKTDPGLHFDWPRYRASLLQPGK
jgi:AmpD protein